MGNKALPLLVALGAGALLLLGGSTAQASTVEPRTDGEDGQGSGKPPAPSAKPPAQGSGKPPAPSAKPPSAKPPSAVDEYAEAAALAAGASSAKPPSAKPPQVVDVPVPVQVSVGPAQNVRTVSAYNPAKAKALAPGLARHIAAKGASYTRKALAEFQAAAGIAPDGIYGPLSASALKHFNGSAPRPLFKGAKGAPATYQEP